MNLLNRIVAILLWLLLLVVALLAAVQPLAAAEWLQQQGSALTDWLHAMQEGEPTSFLVGQAALGIGALLLFGTLLFLEFLSLRQRGVRMRTAEGSSVELDTASISRRLEWELDQLADVITVVPVVRSRGGSVDVRLEIETAPDVDIALKTDEVVDATRTIIGQDLGLKLGRLDVRMRTAPFQPEWNQ
jgi:HAMP domain-containing protein